MYLLQELSHKFLVFLLYIGADVIPERVTRWQDCTYLRVKALISGTTGDFMGKFQGEVCLWDTCLHFWPVSHLLEALTQVLSAPVLPAESQALPKFPSSGLSWHPFPFYENGYSHPYSHSVNNHVGGVVIPLGYLHGKRKCLPMGTFNSGVLHLGSITLGVQSWTFKGL